MADRLQETRWKPFERLKIQSQTHNSSLTSNPVASGGHSEGQTRKTTGSERPQVLRRHRQENKEWQ